jgi:hypothetical protein
MIIVLLLSLSLLPVFVHAATLTVRPGQRIQDTLNRAQTGDTVQVAPGRYEERITIPRDGLTLQGAGPSTILDGSTPASGWMPAPEMGSGVWKAAFGAPQALTVDGKAVWRISDKNMASGEGKTALSRSATSTVSTAEGSVNPWDGIEALFGNHNGLTYLRFRNGETPASKQVRTAPGGGVITVRDRANVTLQGLTIQGGAIGVHVTGSSRQVRVEGNVIRHGSNRVRIDGQASGTVVYGNTLRVDMLGYGRFPPGAQTTSLAVRRWQYDVNKFLIGATQTDDIHVLVQNQTRGTQIFGNDIGVGQTGITFYGSPSEVEIAANVLHDLGNIGIYVNTDRIDGTVTGNRFRNAFHGLRLESTQRTMALRICGNDFEGLTSGTKHVYLAPYRQGGDGPIQVTVCDNTFRGDGWAVDLGATNEFRYRFPGLHVVDNTIATRGISSGGTGPIGLLRNNRILRQGTSVLPRVSQTPETPDPDPVPLPSPPVPRNLRLLQGP